MPTQYDADSIPLTPLQLARRARHANQFGAPTLVAAVAGAFLAMFMLAHIAAAGVTAASALILLGAAGLVALAGVMLAGRLGRQAVSVRQQHRPSRPSRARRTWAWAQRNSRGRHRNTEPDDDEDFDGSDEDTVRVPELEPAG